MHYAKYNMMNGYK